MAVIDREISPELLAKINTDEDAWYGTHTVYLHNAEGDRVAYGSIDLTGGYRIAGDPGIWAVVTVEEHRRKGYATQVMRMLIDIARESGAERVRLQATQAGRYVYEKMGFVPFRDDDYYSESWMVLHISPEGECAPTPHVVIATQRLLTGHPLSDTMYVSVGRLIPHKKEKRNDYWTDCC